MPSIWSFLCGFVFLCHVNCAAAGDDIACTRLRDLSSLEDHVHSQYGEDGVLLGLLDILGTEDGVSSKTYVEFGVEDGVQCNTRVLRELLGWTGLSMDGGYHNPSINLQQEFVTEANILELFQKHQVRSDVDVMSIDVDMFDFWILHRILQSRAYHPRIIVVETNPSLCLANTQDAFTRLMQYKAVNDEAITVTHPSLAHNNQSVWDGTRYAGANPRAFQELAQHYGYDMVHCERCGVNCFLVKRTALPEQCRHEYKGKVPQIPYPCFSTLNAAMPGGTQIGHPVDPLLRPALSLFRGGRGSTTEAGVGSSSSSGGSSSSVDRDSLLDILLSAQTGFDGSTLLSKQAAADSHYFACNAEYPQWGADWFSRVQPWQVNSAASITVMEVYQKGIDAFYAGEYSKAFSKFTLLVDLQMKLDASTVHIGASKAEESFGKCTSKHGSELSCVSMSRTYFNIGLSLLHIAADMTDSSDTDSGSGSGSGNSEVDIAEEQGDYLELAVDSFQQALEHLTNHPSSFSGAGVSGYVDHVRDMVHFLKFFMRTFQLPPTASSTAPASISINSILNQCAHVPIKISFVADNLNTDGTVSGTNTYVETHNAEICTCDDIVEKAGIFCEKHNIGNCEVSYDRLLQAMIEQVFEKIPYDLLSVLNTKKEAIEATQASIARSGIYRGWTPLPDVFRRLKLLENMRGKC
eukprot:GSChrysophyteH2.ASY1.ANO1.1383.1 assembled CDS